MTVRHLAALAAIALSACVSVPNQPYNKAANVHVKKIGVVTVPNPAEYQVGMLHHPGEGFGLIGGLIAAGDASSKTKTFSGQEVVHRVELGKEMTAALTEAFDGSPFQVVLVDAGAAPRTEFVNDYPARNAMPSSTSPSHGSDIELSTPRRLIYPCCLHR